MGVFLWAQLFSVPVYSMDTLNHYARYPTEELRSILDGIREDENPEQYAEIIQELERRKHFGEPYSPRGTTILVTSIVGLVCGIFGVVVALIAWSMGDTALKQMKAANYTEPIERSHVTIGRNCGVIGAVLLLGRLLLGLLLSKSTS